MRRASSKGDVGAEVVVTSSTVIAAAAGYAGLDGYALAYLNVADLAASLNDNAGAFVTEDHGAGDDEFTNAASLPEVDVASADACALDVDSDMVLVGQDRDAPVFERHILNGLENESWVLIQEK